MEPLEALGFHVVGYGCTTCIGNSGPLPDEISKAILENDLVAAAVLSGNRNFEGRVNPSTRSNYLASPPLVVAYALAGTLDINFALDPIGTDEHNEPVFLRDIWPTSLEIELTMHQSVKSDMFRQEYANVFEGEAEWRNLPVPAGAQYAWEPNSTYIKAAPYFDNLQIEPKPLQNIYDARVLALLGDSVTTDHISPAGSFNEKSAAGKFLLSLGVEKKEFNQYGARRGNHEIMMRGTFANIRLKNLLLPGIEGSFTLHPSSAEPISIFDAAMKYKDEKTPLIIIAGKEYGSGSSRDWAAKGPALLGVRAVIAESFERIHRSNLVGMGVLPLQFEEGQNYQSLGLAGFETYNIEGIADDLKPRKKIAVTAISKDGSKKTFSVVCRIDTPNEADYYRHDGILQFVLRSLLKKKETDDAPPLKPATEDTSQRYRIIFKGDIEHGHNRDQVKERLTLLFKTSSERIDKLFTGKRIILNQDVVFSKAQEYSNELKNAGALCFIEPMPKAPSASVKKNIEARPPQPSLKVAGTPTSHVISRKVNNTKNAGQSAPVHSKYFLSGYMMAAAGMILLPLLYIFLIIFIVNITYGHIEDNITLLDKSLAIGLLLYIAPILVGIMLIAVLLKPLIARLSTKNMSIPISRKKEPALYAFIDKLCHAVNSKTPNNIEVDCSVAVSANYRRGVISFLEEDLTLTIGLPVFSEMTISELAGLLAHEFGQQKQKTEMRLSFVITSINQWFKRCVYEQDVIDDKLTALLLTSSVFATQVPLSIAKFFVWLSRKILTLFMLAGHVISRMIVRIIAFDADYCSVSLTSFDSFKSSLTKLNSLASASLEAFSRLKTQRNPNDNSLPDDFILLVSSVNGNMSDKDKIKTKIISQQEKEAIWTGYPSDQERIEHVKNVSSKDMFKSDKPASTLFANFEELTKIATVRLYREILEMKFDKADLIPTNQFDGSPVQTQAKKDIDSNFF